MLTKTYILSLLLFFFAGGTFAQIDSIAQLQTQRNISFSRDTLRIESIDVTPHKPWFKDISFAVLASLISIIVTSFFSVKSLNRNSKNNTQNLRTQYQQNLNAKNVQAWIDELRMSMAKALANAELINTGIARSNTVDGQSSELNHFEVFQENRFKLLLLLRPLKDGGKEILDALAELNSHLYSMVSPASPPVNVDHNTVEVLIGKLAESGSKLAYDIWDKDINKA